MKPNIIHETVIRDILDVIDDVKKIDYVDRIYGNNKSFRSIAQASSNLTLVFPVIVSRSLSINNAAMIAKAMERKAVTMLQMLFSAINISDVEDGIDYVRQFHTNLRIDDKMTVDSFIDAMDSFIINNESALANRELYDAVKRDLRNLNYTLPDSVNETSLNDYLYYPNGGFAGRGIVKEADNNKDNGNNHYRPRRPQFINKNDVKVDSPVINNIIRSGGGRGGTSDKDIIDYYRYQLMDNDVKKANELVPTMMMVNFVSVNDDYEPIKSKIVIGVKAKIYPVDSVDVMNRIVIKNEDNNGFLKFVKATTREISFMKDFILALDRAKIDALSHSRRGSSSKLWKILERRALKSKIRRAMLQRNDASAISTLVISQEEVELLKKTEGIDCLEPRVIRPIMESYNLMSVCVVDESMEVAYFIFDTGNDIYEAVPFNHLERENGDNSYKKVINLMTKMVR